MWMLADETPHLYTGRNLHILIESTRPNCILSAFFSASIMLVWFYRPKNLVCLIAATFGLFVFFQVFVFVPHTGNEKRDDMEPRPGRNQRMAIDMQQEKYEADNRHEDNELNRLRNININIKRDKPDKSKYQDALKPLYDSQNDVYDDGGKDDSFHSNREVDHGNVLNDQAQLSQEEDEAVKKGPDAPHGLPVFPQQVKKILPRNPVLSEVPDVEELTELLRGLTEKAKDHKLTDKSTANMAFNKFTANCTVRVKKNPNLDTPFKIYILSLPSRFNSELLTCLDKVFYDGCFKTSHCGMGPEMYSEHGGDFTARDTWQFSLEVIIHHKLLLSPYRTFNIHEAHAVYVPYYAAADCFCSQLQSQYPSVSENVKRLLRLIREQGSFLSKKPYVMALGKIEREHMSPRCPWLIQSQVVQEMTYIGIEQESNPSFRYYHREASSSLILAPYPSYGHFTTNRGSKYTSTLFNNPRPVFVFLAAASRRSNPFRAKILDQFKGHFTRDQFETYNSANRERKSADGDGYTMVHYGTPECQGEHNRHTLTWMKHSTICLQPPGDSPTRKSIYDAIISGCIPAFFTDTHQVRLPFQNTLDYDKFSITIPASTVEEGINLYQYLRFRYKEDTIKSMQRNLQKVVKNFQYSFPITNDDHTDAVKLILEDLKHSLM